MSSLTHIQPYRRVRDLVPTSPIASDSRFRELWADSLATTAVACLVGILLFEVLRIVGH